MIHRRDFLRTSTAAWTTAAVAVPFQSLLSRSAAGDAIQGTGYGGLQPVADENTGLHLLKLPPGFRYTTYGWTGDAMRNGQPTPAMHDGMAVIADQDGEVILCRNHEIEGRGPSFGEPSITYDPQGPAGCTNLKFNTATGQFEECWISLAGTLRNCAGGPTPWGTWLTCEETVYGSGERTAVRSRDFARDHGWVFEVPAHGSPPTEPIEAMGRFVHEAVAVDPQTGIVYETEDRPTAGFYRFTPSEPGNLHAGGMLEMLKCRHITDLRTAISPGTSLDVQWVPIDEPTRRHAPGTQNELGVFSQGAAQGAAMFARLEGCWYGDGSIFLTATDGGHAHCGQVWRYVPREERLTLLFESPGINVLDNPDNVAVKPGGQLFLCEDGTRPGQRILTLSASGTLAHFAENNVVLAGEKNDLAGDFRGGEWAGVCFSADGNWLFANIQDPGITFAITGPWAA